jgi:uncharacterized membrane protein
MATPQWLRSNRAVLLGWIAHGAIPRSRHTEALAVAGVTPSPRDWRRFLDHLFLWCGAAALAAGVIFFIAANWSRLGRFARLGLVEVVIIAAVLAAWKSGLDRVAGKAALLLATLATGALLALFGQTYQSGADTWELFGTWGVLVLPWILLSRFAAMWLLWLAIVNLAIALYVATFPSFFGILFGFEQQAWAHFGFNTIAWGIWELLAHRYDWLNERWGPRVLAVASGTLITGLACVAVADWDGAVLSIVVYLAWLVAVFYVYRYIEVELFMIAGALLSAIVFVTVFLAVRLEDSLGDGGGLLVALVVIGMTAAAAMWIRNIASEPQS